MSIPVIRLFGIGGCGCKLVNSVAERESGMIEAVAIDTDFAAISRVGYCRQIRIGEDRFSGLGSGGDTASARMAASAAIDDIKRELAGVSIAVVVAGLGGGTGSGALPVFLSIAAQNNVVTMVFMVKPFSMEGPDKMRVASAAELSCASVGDVRIVLDNNALVSDIGDMSMQEAFSVATTKISAGLSLIWRLTTNPAYIRLDPGLLRSMLVSGRGGADFVVAKASGSNRFHDIANQILSDNALGISRVATEARSVLVGIIGGSDLRLSEVGRTVDAVRGTLAMDTPLFLSTSIDARYDGSLEVAIVLYHHWVNSGDQDSVLASTSRAQNGKPSSACTTPAIGVHGRFDPKDTTYVDGIQIDYPTWMRHHMNIDTN